MASKMVSYGLSADKIADVLERDVRTIEEWLQAVGKKSEQFHLFLCITLKLRLFFLQMDELWSFCKAKNHHISGFLSPLRPTANFGVMKNSVLVRITQQVA